MIIIRLLLIAVFLFLVPIVLGAPWTSLLPKRNRYRLCACFPIGFFVELAIFQLLEVPIAFLHMPFTLLCRAFVLIVVCASFYSAFFSWKRKPFAFKITALNKWEVFYLIVFLGLLGLQLYNGFIRDTTVWSYDDATYVTYAADAIRYNAIQTIDPYTGIAAAFNVTRALQGWLYFPAFLSWISSISVAAMERTVLETYDIFLAYAVYAYMASVLYKRSENRLIFLIFLSMLHVFGWYSQYSVTFRLLGPNYQGKAVLAVSFFPLLFTLMIQMLEKDYCAEYGVLLMLFSAAAVSFTLFGALTMILNTVLTVCLSMFRNKRRWKHLWYIPWSVSLPVLYGGIYFIFQYA